MSAGVIVIIDGVQIFPPTNISPSGGTLKFFLDSTMSVTENSFEHNDLLGKQANVIYVGAYAKVLGFGYNQVDSVITFTDGTLVAEGDQIVAIF